MTSPTLEQRAEAAVAALHRQWCRDKTHLYGRLGLTMDECPACIADSHVAFAHEAVAAQLDALEEWAMERDDWRRLRELYPELCCGSACTEAAWAFGLVVAEIARRRAALAPKGTEP